MKNLHIIYSNFDKNQVQILAQHGIRVEAKYDRFDIEENEIYFALKPYLDKWKIDETVISKFTEEEENNARRLVYKGVWANGYPMNDSDFGYRKTTYNDDNFCNTCGIGLVQKEPFRLKKAPNWGGSKKMFSLNWVYDELFVKKEVYESLFKSKGTECEKVLLYKKETIIEDTVQLILPVTEVSLNVEGYPNEVCKDCNRLRYDLINKGFFPSFKEDIDGLQIFKSKEWFGTGANARKYIFVLQELRKELLKIKVNPNYIPCQ
jgi:hypothetical protein